MGMKHLPKEAGILWRGMSWSPLDQHYYDLRMESEAIEAATDLDRDARRHIWVWSILGLPIGVLAFDQEGWFRWTAAFLYAVSHGLVAFIVLLRRRRIRRWWLRAAESCRSLDSHESVE